MISRRTPAFRASALLLLLTAVGAAAVSCAQSDSIDVDGNTSGDGGSGSQAGNGGGGGMSGVVGASSSSVGSGGAGGGQNCDPTESCDGVDNNCDGQVDEGCDCQVGMTQSCYSGAAGTAGTGSCKAGTQTCGAAGKWGACQGEVVPAAEACNSKDDDCDGQTDDDLDIQTCGVGACEVVASGCENGVKPPCVPGQPSAETCDGLDNNCNQLIDESYTEKDKPCTTPNQGVCAAGKYSCMSGILTCVQSVMSSAEVCDGLDNNCNGVVDDAPGTGGSCTTGMPGACGAGTLSCSNGAIDCVSNVLPMAEACDGMDNNCNGQIDEGIPPGASCQTGQGGACAAGNFTCMSGSLVCTPSALGNAEQCNGADDNCNGQTDEGNPGGGASCSVPGKQGPCATGSSACSGGGIVCNQTVQPVAEVCNNSIDDDCNGAVDNGCAAGSCAHNKCVTGAALDPGCDICVTQICFNDPTCCIFSWSASCVNKVTSVCGLTCP